MALITVDEAKDYLGLSGDTYNTLLTTLVDVATADLEREAGRHLATYARTEVLNGTGHELLWLAEPAESVTSVHMDSDQEWDDDSLEDSGDYLVDGCRIEKLDGVWSKAQRNVQVIYKAGYTTPTADLKHAAKIQTAYLYSRRAQAQKALDVVASHNVEGWSETFKAVVDVHPSAARIVKRYRPERL